MEDGRVGLAFPADKELRAKRCRVRKSVSKCPRDLTQPGLRHWATELQTLVPSVISQPYAKNAEEETN